MTDVFATLMGKYLYPKFFSYLLPCCTILLSSVIIDFFKFIYFIFVTFIKFFLQGSNWRTDIFSNFQFNSKVSGNMGFRTIF